MFCMYTFRRKSFSILIAEHKHIHKLEWKVSDSIHMWNVNSGRREWCQGASTGIFYWNRMKTKKWKKFPFFVVVLCLISSTFLKIMVQTYFLTHFHFSKVLLQAFTIHFLCVSCFSVYFQSFDVSTGCSTFFSLFLIYLSNSLCCGNRTGRIKRKMKKYKIERRKKQKNK